ncbi:MAG: four helix bundle protein [Alistipes sp.]|jgi:four helix bundle protein|nr:four helix bundle protein [Alistipes sp.]
MKENVLADKSKSFAIKIVRLYKFLNEVQLEHILSKQLLKSGTSIGANAKEGAYAQTKADLISKLFIAQKECAETEYWLELLYESGYIPTDKFEDMYKDCQELMRILVASTKTLQGKNSTDNIEQLEE